MSYSVAVRPIKTISDWISGLEQSPMLTLILILCAYAVLISLPGIVLWLPGLTGIT